jgi:hypothetical protein
VVLSVQEVLELVLVLVVVAAALVAVTTTVPRQGVST